METTSPQARRPAGHDPPAVPGVPPPVSLLLVPENSDEALQLTLESALKQTLPGTEVLLVMPADHNDSDSCLREGGGIQHSCRS